jgi:hypothetical protein
MLVMREVHELTVEQMRSFLAATETWRSRPRVKPGCDVIWQVVAALSKADLSRICEAGHGMSRARTQGNKPIKAWLSR